MVMPKLADLLTKQPVADVEISGITADSRQVAPGFLFFAIKGAKFDGHDYISQALEAGAAAIIGEDDKSELDNYYKVENIRAVLAENAAKFYNKKPKNIAVVTGTNGKTSVADFVRQIAEHCNADAASIGTLGFGHNGSFAKIAADNTSPDPTTLHQLLEKPNDFAIIEGSSIGLEQHRLDGLKISAAAFTNFTQDHLDYHGSMENYFEAKMLLFTEKMRNGTAVLNKNMPEFEKVKAVCEEHNHKVISFGENADLNLISVNPTEEGQIISTEIFGERYDLKLSLVGAFQAENVLCAIGLALACGLSQEEVMQSISSLKPIPGRMEQAASGVYVDYAHTPDALENALKSIRPHTKNKLITVFGCGGDRDKGKRPQMGAAAANLADISIVTDDNPRTESPEQIRKEILAAMPESIEVADREKAIQKALELKQEGDVVLIAGKGHEKYQIIGDTKHDFDDIEVVKNFGN